MSIKRIFEVNDDNRVAQNVTIAESDDNITISCNGDMVTFAKSMALDVLTAVSKLIE